MPRIVELKDQSPLIIRPQDTANGIVAVCRCGLSANWPYCNGFHKATAGEDPAKLYCYDQQLPQGAPQRREVPRDLLGPPGEPPAKATDEAPQREHHGASPVRPPRPAQGQAPAGEVKREPAPAGAAEAREDAAPPSGPSQAI